MSKAIPNQAQRLVNERLEFVGIIGALNPQFLDAKKIRLTPEGGWTHPWIYFDALRNYLLLTCFDLLGQPTDFKDFQSWLVSESAAVERAEVERALPSSSDHFKITELIHRQWLSIYGTKRSFVRFISEVLPPDVRRELLFSVRIRKIDPVKNVEVEVIESDEKKINWLYQIRNEYTHKARNTGSPAAGVFENWGRPIIVDGKPKMGWEPIDWQQESTFRIEYGVRNWPAELEKAVRHGMDAKKVIDSAQPQK